MAIATGFHARYGLDVMNEIGAAADMFNAMTCRYGYFRLPRMMRTDPAAVFTNWAYGRLPLDYESGRYHLYLNIHRKMGKPSHATNDFILTPSHPEWVKFLGRVHRKTKRPGFEWQVGEHDDGEPFRKIPTSVLAEVAAGLGFAVMESVVLWVCLADDRDASLVENAAARWHRLRPVPGRVPFDAKPDWHQPPGVPYMPPACEHAGSLTKECRQWCEDRDGAGGSL